MFNSGVKKDSLARLNKAHESYEHAAKWTLNKSEELFQARQRCSTEVLVECEKYINELANIPKEYDKSFQAFKAEITIFNSMVNEIEREIIDANIKAGSAAGAGIAAGVGVAALAPSAAMAIATTFGTASTGAAISSLSGAAATNAALAWLGGGTLAAGGGGMASGSALLALAGPVGLGLGVTGFAVAGFLAHKKNGEIAKKANENEKILITATAETKVLTAAIVELLTLTYTHTKGMLWILSLLREGAPKDYTSFDSSQKDKLLALHNHMLSLSKLINKKVTL